MRKFLILILGLSFIAASCDFGNLLSGESSGTRGVFRSEDGGQTYRSSSQLSKGTFSNLSINSIIFDSTNPLILYVGASNGMYKSEDGANSWRYILSGMIVSDIAANFRDDQIIYAAGIAGSSGKIIKSSDGGTTWIDVYNEPSKNNAVLTIAVATTNSAVLVAGLTNGEIIRSFDEGRTWQAIKDFSDRILRIRFSPSGSFIKLPLKNASLRTSAVTVDPSNSNVIYAAVAATVLKSVNGGLTWETKVLPIAGSEVRSIIVNPQSANFIYLGVGNKR